MTIYLFACEGGKLSGELTGWEMWSILMHRPAKERWQEIRCLFGFINQNELGVSV